MNSRLFGLFPWNWGLEGKERERAYAKYTLTGESLDYALLAIDNDDKSSKEYRLGKLDLDLKYNKIAQREYDKLRATANGEAYFRVIQGDYTETGLNQGTMTFELDWNDFFVAELHASGWTGADENEIVNAWFESACKQMFIEYEPEEEEYQPPITSYNRTRKRPLGDTTEYS